MKKISAFIIISVNIFVFGCNSGKSEKDVQINLDKVASQDLKGEQILSSLLCESMVEIVDEQLLLFNECTESLINVYDLNNMTPVSSFGAIGDGPDEFLFPVIMRSTLSDDQSAFVIHDLNRKRISFYNMKNILAGNHSADSMAYINTNVLGATELNFIDNQYMLGNYQATSGSRGQFVVHNIKENTSEWKEFYPELPFTLPDHTQGVAYQSEMLHWQSAGLTISAMSYFNRINIFEKDGKLLKSLVIGDAYTPDIFKKESDAIPPMEVQYFTADIRATNDYVYLLYVDKKYEEFIGPDIDKPSGFKFLVLNREGKIVKNLNIEEHIWQFTVSDDNSQIIGSGYGSNGEPGIFKYNL